MKKILFLLVSFFALGGAFGSFGPTPWSKKVVVPRGTSLLRATMSDNDRRKILRGGGLTEEVEPLPTMRDYRKFALPCLALWVIGPMLSLIDTAFVGLSGDAALSAGQIAALGPATTFFDGATYLFAFLNVASTNLYSSARAQYGESSPQAESVVRTAARSALVSGFCVMGLLLAFARPLLGLYIGHDASSSPEILNWATEYVKIRAFSMPTSLLLGVLQACLLGAKDSVTPLIAVVYAMVVNVVGDYIGVTYLGQGLKGAAIATTIAQWASTWALMGPARKKLVVDHDLGLTSNKHRMKKTTSVSGVAADDDGAVTAKAFLKFAVPVLTLIVGKLAAFGFMTHSAAGLSGQPTTLAAHQIILSTFFFISPFLEVISQTAQTFLPPYVTPVREYVARRLKTDASYDVATDALAQSWFAAAFTVATRLLGIGLVVASIVASIVSLIPAFFGNFITSDVVVQEAVKPLAKYLWAGAFLTAPVAVSEGVLLARRELPFLASVYLVSTIVLPFALIEIKRQSGPVIHVWGCFAAFQLFRASCFASRIWGKPLLNAASNLLRGKKQVSAPIEPPEPEPETGVLPAIS